MTKRMTTEAKLADIDARAAEAASNIRAVEAKAVRDTLAAYALFGLMIVERYEALVAKGDRPTESAIRWADIRPHVVGAGVGGRYCGLAEAACERAWIVSRDLATEAQINAWAEAGTAAKLAAAEAKAEAKRVAADPTATEATKAEATKAAKVAAEAADHLAYEGTSIKSAVSYAAAKRGGRIDATTKAIAPGSGRGGTGGGKAVDPAVTQSVDYITRYREGTTPFGILPVAGDATVAIVAALTVEEANHLAKVLAALVAAKVLPTKAEAAKADTEADTEATTTEAEATTTEADTKAEAKAALAAELAALTAKVAALTE